MLYHSHPELWNPKNINHKNKVKKDNTWRTIAVVMGTEQTEVVKKMETLMT